MRTLRRSTHPAPRETLLCWILTPVIAAMIISTGVHASGPAPTRDQTVYEIRFLTEMIDHHAMAVMMADLCLDRTIHPQLHQLCASIKEAQTEEVAAMQTWLEKWYGIDHDPQMTPGARQRMEKSASLTGAEFEIEFMKEMIQHHWMAVVRARECQDFAPVLRRGLHFATGKSGRGRRWASSA